MLKIYKLTINDNDNTGVDYTAFVDVPAHLKGFVSFNKNEPLKYEFNEEKRIVTGVMISADLPIYRKDSELGEHYVLFDSETITQIKEKFHKLGNNNNVNEMHDPALKQSGVFLVASYQIGGDKNPSAPKIFEGQELKDGTWIASYKVENDELWAKVKNGEFQGFSVEGMFYKEPVKMNNEKMKLAKGKFAKISQISKWDMDIDQDTIEVGTALTTTYQCEDNDPMVSKVYSGEYTTTDGKRILVDSDGIVRLIFKKEKMSKKTKSIWEMMGLKKSTEKFTQATTSDGVVLIYDGELAEGTAVLVDKEGEQVPAPEGEHQVTLEDGTVKVITLDSGGIVTAIADGEVMEDDGVRGEVAELMSKVLKDTEERFAKIEAENVELKKEILEFREALKDPSNHKFNNKPLDVEVKKLTIAEMMAAQNK